MADRLGQQCGNYRLVSLLEQGAYFNCLLGGKPSLPTGALAGRYDIAEFAVNFSYDPDDSSLLRCSQIAPTELNITYYCNPKLDALYQEELSTPDAGARQNIFMQIHSIYMTDFPIIVLLGAKDVYVVRKGRHNFQSEPTSAFKTINIWRRWCDNGKC